MVIDYLRSVGFDSDMSLKEFRDVIEYTIENSLSLRKTLSEDGSVCAEIRSSFGDSMGMILCGKYDDDDIFHLDFFLPYLENNINSIEGDVSVAKRPLVQGFLAETDDTFLGYTLNFVLQNPFDFIIKGFRENENYNAFVSLSGFSLHGKILLGVFCPNSTAGMNRIDKEFLDDRKDLLKRIKEGDSDAVEYISQKEGILIENVKRRNINEDLYSIVDTSLRPTSQFPWVYHIIGTIVNWRVIKNKVTKGLVYNFLLNCHDLFISICINKEDLKGVPAIGRRYKGIVHLQGSIRYEGELR